MDRVAQIDARFLVIDRDQAAHPEAYLVLAQERLALTHERAALTNPQGKFIIPMVLFNYVVTFYFVSFTFSLSITFVMSLL